MTGRSSAGSNGFVLSSTYPFRQAERLQMARISLDSASVTEMERGLTRLLTAAVMDQRPLRQWEMDEAFVLSVSTSPAR